MNRYDTEEADKLFSLASVVAANISTGKAKLFEKYGSCSWICMGLHLQVSQGPCERALLRRRFHAVLI